MKRFLTLIFVFALMTPRAQAHSLWINAFESRTHPPAHAMVSVGWGHDLPMGDMLTAPGARIAMERFELISPGLVPTPLGLPAAALSSPVSTTKDFDLFRADTAARKVAFKKDCTSGVYQFSLVSKPTAYTSYIDTKGKKRLSLKPKNKVKNLEKVLMSVQYQAFAKTFVTKGKWTAPAPLGHRLEIVPATDLSRVRVNDLVEVEVLFCGRPLNSTPGNKAFLTAQGAGFGQDDGFALYAKIKKGRARIRAQAPGQWRIMVTHTRKVADDDSLKALAGQVDMVTYGASLTFHVR